MPSKPAFGSPPSVPRVILSASVVALVAALGVSRPTAVHAQDAQTQAMGRALFNDGVALFNKGDYEAACLKFEASLKAYPGIGTRGKLAECYEKQGRIASAWAAYREVAQLATKSGDATREQVAAERAKALEPKLSYITVTLPPASDVPGLVIKRNGRELERSKLGIADPIDPGSVIFDLSAPGKKQLRKIVPVNHGVAAKFEVPALAPEDAPHVAPVEPSPVTTTEPPPIVQSDPPQWQKPVGVVAMGLGAVGLGLGTVFGLSASSKYDAAFDNGGCTRADNTCDRAGQDKVDDARSKAGLSTVFFIAGGVLAASGIVLFLTAPSSSRRGSLYLTPNIGGVSVGGTL